MPNLPCGLSIVGWELSQERQPQFKISTLASLLQSVRFWCARVLGVPDLPCGVGSSVGSDRACSNNGVHDHRHAPSKHNSSTDKRLRRWLPVCLPTLIEQGAEPSTCQRKPLSKTTYGLNTKFPSSSISVFCFSSNFSPPQASTIV